MPLAPLIEAFANIDNLAADNASGKPLSLLESMFTSSHNHTAGIKSFIEGLIKSSYWKSQDFPDNPFPRLCINLSLEIDRMQDAIEPPYHCRGHFQDVCLAITLLMQQPIHYPIHYPIQTPDQSLWLMTPKEAWLLLFCAIGHDYGHDGSINQTPNELEKRSIEKIDAFLHEFNEPPVLIEEIMPKVRPIILATDPSVFGNLVDKFTSNLPIITKEDCMSMLLVEADLMGSALPGHGVRLGQQLGLEWQTAHPEMAHRVASDQGRLSFLQHIRFMSPHSEMLGLDKIRQESINQIKT